MRALEAADLKVVPTGLRHGTVTAIVKGRPFELTTLRRDVETDGRRAVVAFTDDWRTDAGRRDFTFNALYADRRRARSTIISTAAPTFWPAACASSAIPISASPRITCASCASSASTPGSASRRSTRRASTPAAAMPARSATCRASASPRNCCACWPRRRRPTRWRRWPRPAPSITGCRNIPARNGLRGLVEREDVADPAAPPGRDPRRPPATAVARRLKLSTQESLRLQLMLEPAVPGDYGEPARRPLPARHQPVHRPPPARGARRLARRARRGAPLDAAGIAGRRRRCAGARPESRGPRWARCSKPSSAGGSTAIFPPTARPASPN